MQLTVKTCPSPSQTLIQTQTQTKPQGHIQAESHPILSPDKYITQNHVKIVNTKCEHKMWSSTTVASIIQQKLYSSEVKTTLIQFFIWQMHIHLHNKHRLLQNYVSMTYTHTSSQQTLIASEVGFYDKHTCILTTNTDCFRIVFLCWQVIASCNQISSAVVSLPSLKRPAKFLSPPKWNCAKTFSQRHCIDQ